MPESVHRTCHLCEACCGLEFQVEDDKILSVRPDAGDPFSQGYACPKGIAIADVHDDPDRLRQPMRRTPAGDFEPISWDTAIAEACARLDEVRTRHGRDAVAAYIGNPIVHDYAAALVRAGLMAALGSRNCYSAGSQDTSPRFASSWHLYGSSFATPIPDLERTDYLLCIGANPVVSNGSLLTAPNMRARLRALRARGGRLVVVDPRRSETAREADEHVAILPGGDTALLLGMLRVLVDEGRVDRAAVAEQARGFAEVERRLHALEPAALEAESGLSFETIARLAREFVDARTSAAYSRVGVCNSRQGTLATWGTDLLNLAAGRLGAVGGAMFTTPAADLSVLSRLPGMDGHGRFRSRVRGLPETLGDLPAACLAEEIETPGEGQVRALLTYAGNPVLSVPNGRRLDAALAGLDFMVSIDLYLNETTRHAHLVLPPAWSLAEEHYDLLFAPVAVRNFARWSPAVVEPEPGERADWEILVALAEGLGGGMTGSKPLDRALAWARRRGLAVTPAHVLDLMIRTGRHGDGLLPRALRFGRFRNGLSLARLREHPRGVDLGPLEPGVARRVLHRDRKVHVDAPALLEALDHWLRQPASAAPSEGELLLIGRRELRTNNSWMHNVPALVSGRERCVLLVHPDDAKRASVADGETAVLESRVHRGEVPVRLSNDMRPGVVSLPHGWGHAPAAPYLRTAATRPGVSFNDWSDDAPTEPVVGQSILNGIPVRLYPTGGTFLRNC
ncbi:MAG: molybdopterin-dependent oxidoreductase [Myxococcota bacterium]|nr:molybdopterin-dependent oxidoreductase [Myxococcota bacterium]